MTNYCTGVDGRITLLILNKGHSLIVQKDVEVYNMKIDGPEKS